ncbi:DNA/RNA non-specific endonuclease [Streptomyces sp. NBC_00094]|uniref:DNA/RNA non-specific endonuclease n=1 Tax=Streptomyces sp. NBC_00094 TaxID=2903620 RepID=UPI00224D8B96|nr:DNA/RNA non-specific endonuclease [Streptomyces sp. NBC_00094]MCX5394376.1 DNA/RNA non-specific endonuclease [Streptomyces sp. NBC_00094]
MNPSDPASSAGGTGASPGTSPGASPGTSSAASSGASSRGALADRAGYDETFLGPVVPLPLPVRDTVRTVILPYTHFTVVFRPDRRLAASTAVCIEGRELQEDVPRDDAWVFDPRLPEEQQAGDEIYRNNSLDRGHLVRRLDPVWGPAAVAVRANADTFHFTNAAPQADVFNQGKQIWQGLENHILDHAAEFDRKLTVLTGPVLQDSDPPYRGIQVPMRFWKVAAFVQDGALAASAYVLDQSPDLSRDAERALAGAKAGAPPPLGPYRTYQVPVSDVAELTELEFGPLPDVDVMPPSRGPEDRWRRLESYGDIVLHH